MRFTPPEPAFELYETGFADDKLNRTRLSRSLSRLVSEYNDPLVIALDGKWGTGKSFFLKRWVAAHVSENSGIGKTIYFDAFANDYGQDPLTALTAELAERFPPESAARRKIQSLAFAFLKPAIKAGFALAGTGISLGLPPVGDAAVDALVNEASQSLDDFWKEQAARRSAIIAFRDHLRKLTAGDNGENQPLVFVIDELDRCRPDYALSLLEIIKHFFSVDSVHFILGVNFEALSDMVRVRYGNSTDGYAYLKKFFSLIMQMPDHVDDYERTSDNLVYLDYAADLMGISTDLRDEIKAQVAVISRKTPISLRDTARILSLISILPKEEVSDPRTYGKKTVAVTLAITRIVRPDFLSKLIRLDLTDQELHDFFGATSELITQHFDDGNYNPAYDHKTFYVVSIWDYVLSNGAKAGSGETEHPRQAFGRSSFVNLKNVPKSLFDNWLMNISIP